MTKIYIMPQLHWETKRDTLDRCESIIYFSLGYTVREYVYPGPAESFSRYEYSFPGSGSIPCASVQDGIAVCESHNLSLEPKNMICIGTLDLNKD